MKCNVNINLSNTSFKTCGDVGIDINNKLISSVDDMVTVGEFNNIIHTELIDVKSRKIISGYPLLKVVYDRYKKSFGGPNSSTYDYLEMGKFVKLVGDYWVDLIEQVIPTTAMWGSTYKYKNTIFDSQKFAYKKYTLKTCDIPSGVIFPSPTHGLTNLVDVEVTNITLPDYAEANCLTPSGETTHCEGLYIEQINHGSEFIGTVSTMKTPTTGDTIIVQECDLVIDEITHKIGEQNINLTPTISGGEGSYTYNWVITEQTGGMSGLYIVDNTAETCILAVENGDIMDVNSVCVELLVTDINNCGYELEYCYEHTEAG